MNKNDLNIEEVSDYMKKHDSEQLDYSILVKNKNTKQEGYAVITVDKRIKVFEGKEDGSDDHIYSIKEFKERYKILQVLEERQKIDKEEIFYKKDSDVYYIAFCLGYDLLNNELRKSETSECDRVYDLCNYLAKKFIETEYYKNPCKSTYDSLQEWINDNKEIIQSEYSNTFKKENKTKHKERER